jgi:hypothetical protein
MTNKYQVVSTKCLVLNDLEILLRFDKEGIPRQIICNNYEAGSKNCKILEEMPEESSFGKSCFYTRDWKAL